METSASGEKTSTWLPWLVLLLLGAWPFVSFLDHNRDDAPVYWSSIVVYAAVFVAGLVALTWLGRWLLGRGRTAQLALTLGVGAVCLFNYLPVAQVMSDLGVSLGTVKIATWLVLTLVAMAITWRLAAWPNTALVLCVAALAMMAMPVTRLAQFALEAGQLKTAKAMSAKPAAIPSAAEQPNVYWIVLDAYSRADVLKAYFRYDNDEFISALRARRFFVADRGYSNYASTKLSISTTATMDYYLPVDQPLHPQLWTARLQGFNAAVDRFLEKGYRYVHAGPGGNNGKTRCGGREELCITSAPTGTLGLNEADVGLLRLTAVFPMVQRMLPGFLSFDFTNIGDVAAKLTVWPQSPAFAFVHILSPHPPPRYEADCSRIKNVAFDLVGDDVDSNPHTYLNDLKCLNPQVVAFVDTVLAKDRTDPIIIIQSDHGFRGLPEVLPDATGPAIDRKLIRYAPLNAMRLPERCAGLARNDMTLVNTFRLVFTCLGDPDLPQVADRMFEHGESVIRSIEMNKETVR
jgi:hypothetical protein